MLVSFGQGCRTANHACFYHAIGASHDTIAVAYYMASQLDDIYSSYLMANRSIPRV